MNTFMEELPMTIISVFAMLTIVALILLHVPVDNPLILGVLAPLIYFGANGLIRLKSGQQITPEQMQQLATMLAQLQAPAQASVAPAPAPTPEPAKLNSVPAPQPEVHTEPIPQE